LNNTSLTVFKILCEDVSTGKWLFLNREGKPLQSIKKGFRCACAWAGIENLRPYDLRHTFATRLVDRSIHEYVISALLGHTMPVSGFGYASRITPGYAHATWEAMARAVESLEYPPAFPSVFQSQSGKSG
jgi:integrase